MWSLYRRWNNMLLVIVLLFVSLILMVLLSIAYIPSFLSMPPLIKKANKDMKVAKFGIIPSYCLGIVFILLMPTKGFEVIFGMIGIGLIFAPSLALGVYLASIFATKILKWRSK